MEEKQYQLPDLLYLMACLRHPESGCPWDLEQTFQSIVPHTLEEAYEVADAIEKQDYQHLKEELGDLLLQVVFYTQLAKEQNLYEFEDVVDQLVKKLLRRHPHVFPDGQLESFMGADAGKQITSETVKQNWEAIKQVEKNLTQTTQDDALVSSKSVFDGLPLGFPGLSRAAKLQRKAASLGFDWPEKSPVFAQLLAEIAELEEVLQQQAKLEANDLANNIKTTAETLHDRVVDELGDVMFSAVNLARHYGLDAEQVMRQANNKFERRFRKVEQFILESGKVPEHFTLAELESFWAKAKLYLAES